VVKKAKKKGSRREEGEIVLAHCGLGNPGSK
jgi:hypothetical protein